jgi:hypothetical protein
MGYFSLDDNMIIQVPPPPHPLFYPASVCASARSVCLE